MRFFEPSPEFVPWLVQRYPTATFVDMGCGEGHLVRELLQHFEAETGVRGRALGVDLRALHEADLDGRIIIGDATERLGVGKAQYRVESSMLKTLLDPVMLFCRPCHGDFVEYTLHVQQPPRAVYIGRASKAQQDLGKFFEMFTAVEAPGLDGTSGDPPEDPTVFLEYIANPGEYLLSPMDVVRKDVNARARNSYPPDEQGLFGWISPTGELVTCEYWQHDMLAMAMGYSTRIFERLGWGRLHARDDDRLYVTMTDQNGDLSFDQITETQAIVISALETAWKTNPEALMALTIESLFPEAEELERYLNDTEKE